MAPNDVARKNHDELFPGHVSAFAVTDPELIETFDNFAFDDVLRHSHLDVRTRLMVQLAAMIACQALREYRVMLGAALAAGVTPVEAKEIVYQAVPYVGMAKAFDFIHATNEVLAERGINLPLLVNQPQRQKTALRKALRSKNRSSATTWWKGSILLHRRISCISSNFFRQIALAITTLARGLISRCASF